MNNKQKQITGTLIVVGAIAASTMVYAKVLDEVRPSTEKDQQIPVSTQLLTQSNAVSVDGNEIVLLKDDQLMVIDRQTLKVKKSRTFSTPSTKQSSRVAPVTHATLPLTD